MPGGWPCLLYTSGLGLTFNKYTGARGKSGSNDANAEYIARLRRVFDQEDVSYQTAELGKVDQGGGGTIAYIPVSYTHLQDAAATARKRNKSIISRGLTGRVQVA